MTRRDRMECPTCDRLVAYAYVQHGNAGRPPIRRLYPHDGMELAPGVQIHAARYKPCPVREVSWRKGQGWRAG